MHSFGDLRLGDAFSPQLTYKRGVSSFSIERGFTGKRGYYFRDFFPPNSKESQEFLKSILIKEAYMAQEKRGRSCVPVYLLMIFSCFR